MVFFNVPSVVIKYGPFQCCQLDKIWFQCRQFWIKYGFNVSVSWIKYVNNIQCRQLDKFLWFKEGFRQLDKI